MGFFQNLLGVTPDNSANKVDAAVAPYNYQQYAQPFDYFGLSAVSRAQAMQVPAVARARNIICATIGSLPLEVRRESNNSKVVTPLFIRQPDPRMKEIQFIHFWQKIYYLQVKVIYELWNLAQTDDLYQLNGFQ
jgi:phage portal protein BeeE